MCLGVPGRVDRDRWTTLPQVDFWGVKGGCGSTSSTSRSQPGDYVLNHVGFAIRRIPADDIETTLALYEELMQGRRPTI
jgi:hydrogenase expression/formation protein HypC